ncbi:hypothetical protein Nepgr_024639 [Nepenthes gracilis]|uniref:Uncharacterized protein n=1 Tax=Nepenthes gracilis TaxID=150966 RepID=A0AAD3T551_NEPGR|nr:hypothetical protein Nepgr_024639 [Nepenthes gracilis]
MVQTSTESLGVENTRRSTDFTPSIWADCFISNQQVINAVTQHEHEKLKEEVRRIVVGLHDSPSLQPKLILIDTLQCLGIFYHFETEIEDILQSVHQHHVYDGDDNCNDLLSAALLFRLLRQERIYISPDIFKKFQDDKRHFKESLIHDIRGILALYEASFLGMHGELILDEAQAFAITHLKSSIAMGTCPPELLEQVIHALDVPFHWNFARLEARHYILVYKQNMSNAHEEALLKFAALDFNIVQALHHNEISQITRWWKELNTIKMPRFIRSRVVEYFFMALMVYFQPDYSEARILAVKLIHLITPIDDAHDNYGTMKELELFMDALERSLLL